MSQTKQRTDNFPRGALYGAAAMLGFALLFTALVRLDVIGNGAGPDLRQAVVSRSLQFHDSAAGEVLVIDANSGQQVAVLEAGSNGFLRATLRGLANERKAKGGGANTPFELTLWEDGGLSLIDPVTGREVGLQAFGQTNARVFAKFLEIQQGTL